MTEKYGKNDLIFLVLRLASWISQLVTVMTIALMLISLSGLKGIVVCAVVLVIEPLKLYFFHGLQESSVFCVVFLDLGFGFLQS